MDHQKDAGSSPQDEPDVSATHRVAQGNTIHGLIQQLIGKITNVPPLEDFRWRDLFSEAVKFRSREELESLFNCGGFQTTPKIQEIETRWPHPWAFAQVLLLSLAMLLCFIIGVEWFQNVKVLPGLMIVGAFAIPLTCVVFFFELNILRNTSVFQVAKLVLVGGVMSILVSLLLYKITGLDKTFLGATAAGIVEEYGKLLAAVYLIRKISNYKWILNGLLAGAAVGAGFAGFETAGYILEAGLGLNGNGFYETLVQRGLYAPFCHVVWTACSVGALWRTKGDAAFRFEMLWRKDFLRIFAFIVGLHMLWNSGLYWWGPGLLPTNPVGAKLILLLWSVPTLGSWYLALTLVQAGFKQIRKSQSEPTISAGSSTNTQAYKGRTEKLNEVPNRPSGTPQANSPMGICIQCNYLNPRDNRFCSECGVNLFESCLTCKTDNPVGTKFCGKCGLKMPSFKRIEDLQRQADELTQSARQVSPAQEVQLISDARQRLQNILTESPTDIVVQRELIETEKRLRDAFLKLAASQTKIEATETYRRMQQILPSYPDASVELARIEQTIHATTAQLESLIKASCFSEAADKANKAMESLGESTDLLELRRKAGIGAGLLNQVRSERGFQAITTYRKLLSVFPNNAEALARVQELEHALQELREYAAMLIGAEDFRLAIREIDTGMGQFGPDAGLLELRKQAEAGQARVVQCIRESIPGLLQERMFVTVLSHLDKLVLLQADLESLAQFREQATLAVKQAEDLVKRAGEWLDIDKPDAALAEFKKALEICPDFEKAIAGIEKAELAQKRAIEERRANRQSMVVVGVFFILIAVVISTTFTVRKVKEFLDSRAWEQTQRAIIASGQDEEKILDLYDCYLRGHAKGRGASIATQARAQIHQARQDRKVWAETQAKVKAAKDDESQIIQPYQEYLRVHPNGIGSATAAQALAHIERLQQDRGAWVQMNKAIKESNGDETQSERLYKEYLGKHPNGVGAITVTQALVKLERVRAERMAWSHTQEKIKAEQAVGSATQIEELYKSYLREHPDGPGVSAATESLAQLERDRAEQIVWEQTQDKINSANGDELSIEKLYKSYIAEHPNGPGASPATRFLARLHQGRLEQQDRDAWVKMKEAIITANGDEVQIRQLYNDYLNNHPTGAGVSAAKQALAQLEQVRADRVAWTRTLMAVADSIKGYGGDEARTKELYKTYLSDHPDGTGASTARDAIARIEKHQQIIQENKRLAEQEQERLRLEELSYQHVKINFSRVFEPFKTVDSDKARSDADISNLIECYPDVTDVKLVEKKAYRWQNQDGETRYLEQIDFVYKVNVKSGSNLEQFSRFIASKIEGQRNRLSLSSY